jgi:glutaredoxin 3
MVPRNKEKMMPEITVYSKSTCPYCARAKALLNKKGASFTEIDILQHPEERATMIQRSDGRSTVPQIFIGDKHIGGCDDLHALDFDGQLDPLLKA